MRRVAEMGRWDASGFRDEMPQRHVAVEAQLHEPRCSEAKRVRPVKAREHGVVESVAVKAHSTQ